MTKVSAGFRSVAAGSLLMVVLAGCGESKVSQCNRLAEVVSQTQSSMQEFESEIQSFSDSAQSVKSLDDIKAAATQYTDAVDKVVGSLDQLIADLSATELADEQLVAFRDQYVQVVQGFQGALKDASSAMVLVQSVETEAELPARIEESQGKTLEAVNQIESLSQQEATIIQEVNTYCGAAPAGEEG